MSGWGGGRAMSLRLDETGTTQRTGKRKTHLSTFPGVLEEQPDKRVQQPHDPLHFPQRVTSEFRGDYARMQSIGDDSRSFERTPCETDAKHDIRELGVSVCLPTVVLARVVEIRKVDRATTMGGGRDVDYPSVSGMRRGLFESVEEEESEQSVAEVVRCELEFVRLGGEVLPREGHDPGVVDQTVLSRSIK